MSLVLVRIDCRLIHGQVIEAWVPYTKADCVIVANDDAADDMLQRSIMEMAVPPTVEVAILKVEDAAKLLASGKWADKRVVLLFSNCHDAMTARKAGLRFQAINLGNLVCTPEKTRVTCSLYFDRSDLDCLEYMKQDGVRVEARPVPLDSSIELNELLVTCGKALANC